MIAEADILASLRQALQEAQDDATPLVDRLHRLSGIGSTADNFLTKLVSGTDAVAGGASTGQGLFPAASERIRKGLIHVVSQAVSCFERSIKPALQQRGICIRPFAELTLPQQRQANDFFRQATLPVLTPLGFDPGRPFPKISNLSVNLAVLVRDKQTRKRFARIKVPDDLPQLVRVDRRPGAVRRGAEPEYLWLEDLITANLAQLFPGLEVETAHPFRIIRGRETATDTSASLRHADRRRKRLGRVVQLQVERRMPAAILHILTDNLRVSPAAVCRLDGLIALSRLSHVAALDLLARKPSRAKTVTLHHPDRPHWDHSLSA
jgi:polyphosphate kinase